MIYRGGEMMIALIVVVFLFFIAGLILVAREHKYGRKRDRLLLEKFNQAMCRKRVADHRREIQRCRNAKAG